MAIDTAKSLGCYMSGITAKHLCDKKEEIVLSFTWEIILVPLYLTSASYFKCSML